VSWYYGFVNQTPCFSASWVFFGNRISIFVLKLYSVWNYQHESYRLEKQVSIIQLLNFQWKLFKEEVQSDRVCPIPLAPGRSFLRSPGH
jgi:hypothetical protein